MCVWGGVFSVNNDIAEHFPSRGISSFLMRIFCGRNLASRFSPTTTTAATTTTTAGDPTDAAGLDAGVVDHNVGVPAGHDKLGHLAGNVHHLQPKHQEMQSTKRLGVGGIGLSSEVRLATPTRLIKKEKRTP